MIIMALMMIGTVAFIELLLFHSLQPSKFKPERYAYNPALYTNAGIRIFMRYFKQYQLKVMKKVYDLGPWIQADTMHSIIFSFGISIVLGLIFPAMGVIAFMGGVASTCLTQPYYWVLRKVEFIRGKLHKQ